jgi:hypothetical protein
MTTPAIAATPNGTTTYKFPETKTLQCVFYYEKAVYQTAIFYATTLAKKANALLASHQLDLRVSPQLPTMFGGGDYVFSYDQQIFSGTDSEATDVFTAAKPAFAPPANMLPVIFCTLVDGGGTAGSTNHVTVGGVSYTIILIFANNSNPDFVTLLHEIGHAAGLWPTGHPPGTSPTLPTPRTSCVPTGT